MAAPRATEAAIRRALAAWKDAGLVVGQMEVTRDGDVIIKAPQIDETAKPVQTAQPKPWRKIG